MPHLLAIICHYIYKRAICLGETVLLYFLVFLLVTYNSGHTNEPIEIHIA